MQILLIGPMGVGKSSVAKLLSAQLSLPLVDVDELRWKRFAAMPDYDADLVDALFTADEGDKAFAYMKPFEAALVEDLLGAAEPGIYDFGAGYTVYEDDVLSARVRSAFAPYENTIYLRYSGDKEESLAALSKRHDDVPQALYAAMNRQFIESTCNDVLAKHTIDTKGKTVAQVAEDVLHAIGMA